MKSEQHGELDEFGTTPRCALKTSSWLRLPKKACLRGHWYWRAPQDGSPLLFQGTKTKNSEGWPGHLWNSLCVSGKKHFSKSWFNFWFQLTPGPSGFGCSVHCLHYLPLGDHLPTRYQISLLRPNNNSQLSIAIIYLPGFNQKWFCLCIHFCKHSDRSCVTERICKNANNLFSFPQRNESWSLE